MTYLIGALCVFNVPLAAGLAVVLCLILMGKQSLHYFAGNWIQHFELRDGLFYWHFLIALPLMPDQAMGHSTQSICDSKTADHDF